MGTKTPVSALQEYLVSIKQVPAYELIYNKTGTHNPEFIFRVHVNDLFEDGKGKSKQEAKHRAAEKMLKTLNSQNSEVENTISLMDVEDPSMDLMENYVGQLKEYCLVQPYPEPKYIVEEEAGPAHCKVFKMVCFVSQLQEFGISKTKKAAKQQAAYKMLVRLKKLLNDKNKSNRTDTTDFPNCGTVNKIPSETASDEEVIKKYTSLKSNALVLNNRDRDRAVFYKDQHRAYIGLQETSSTLGKILLDRSMLKIENALNLLNDIVTELGANISFTRASVDLDCEKDAEFVIIGISSNSEWPTISGLGVNDDFAAFNILESLLFLCC